MDIDIVERLKIADMAYHPLNFEAADEIENLRREVAALEVDLKSAMRREYLVAANLRFERKLHAATAKEAAEAQALLSRLMDVTEKMRAAGGALVSLLNQQGEQS